MPRRRSKLLAKTTLRSVRRSTVRVATCPSVGFVFTGVTLSSHGARTAHGWLEAGEFVFPVVFSVLFCACVLCLPSGRGSCLSPASEGVGIAFLRGSGECA